MKKIISILLVLTIVMSLASTVFATNEVPAYFYIVKGVLEKTYEAEGISCSVIYNETTKATESYIGLGADLKYALKSKQKNIIDAWEKLKDILLNINKNYYETLKNFDEYDNSDIVTILVEEINKDNRYNSDDIMLKIVNDKVVYDFLAE